MKELIKTSDFSVIWDSLHPDWHIGKPHEECDAKFEISLGCLHFVFWKKDDEI